MPGVVDCDWIGKRAETGYWNRFTASVHDGVHYDIVCERIANGIATVIDAAHVYARITRKNRYIGYASIFIDKAFPIWYELLAPVWIDYHLA